MKRKEDAFTLLSTDVQISTPLQLLLAPNVSSSLCVIDPYGQ